MDNAKPDKGKNGFFLDLFLGAEYGPGGYSWIFPTSDHEVKAGFCKMDPTYTVTGEQNQKQFFSSRALLRYVLTHVVKCVVKDSDLGSDGDIDGRRASSSLVVGGEASDFAGSFGPWVIGWRCGPSP
jgi:flavin-dependent dehydrogenase